MVGKVRLGGREAIELTWSRLLGRMSVTTDLWVDAQAYIPLSSVTTTRAKAGGRDLLLTTETTSYQIRPATPANLKLLSPPIPPGFTRVATSPHF